MVKNALAKMKTAHSKFVEKCSNLYWKVLEPKTSKRIGFALMAFGAMVLSARLALAFSAPAAGSFAYTVYDVAINQMLNGAIGFVAGVSAMVLGAVMAIQQKIMLAIPCILGGAVLLNAETLVTTLGAVF